jgi:hypothetical protein
MPSNRKECSLYPCGYVKWRLKEGQGIANPLPLDGDCGINKSNCVRLVPPALRPDSVPKFDSKKDERPVADTELRRGLRSYPDPNDPDWIRYHIGSTHR